jgi:hypothetical protein
MPVFNLIKNGEIVNKITADQSFIDLIKKDYDSVELVPEPDISDLQPSEPIIIVNPVVSPVSFKLLFTSQERIAIASARASDAVIDDFFSLLDDPRLMSVNRNLPQVKEGLDYLVTKNLITTARKEQILTTNI